MLKVKRLNDDAIMPTCAHPGEDLGYDVYASEDTVLRYGIATLVPCGISVQFKTWDTKFGLLVRDRSSMALKGIYTTGGVIDSGYTGELKVFLTDQVNRGLQYVVKKGDKIAQIVPIPVFTYGPIEEVMELGESLRGNKGYGSSDKCKDCNGDGWYDSGHPDQPLRCEICNNDTYLDKFTVNLGGEKW